MHRIMKYDLVNTIIRTAVLGGTPTEQTGVRARSEHSSLSLPVAYRGGVGVFKPPLNSEDIGGVLDRMSKNRRFNFLL